MNTTKQTQIVETTGFDQPEMQEFELRPALNTQDRVQAWTEKHNVTMKADFVPFSKSRNSEEKHPSLNWKITLIKNGREFMRFDYMQGSGHAPSYKQNMKYQREVDAVKHECETGKESRYSCDTYRRGKPVPSPSIVDVLHSVQSDASAIDCPTYEDFAAEFGYESDSRKGEAIYKQCLEHGLKLRAAVGDQGLQKLREAVQDW